ncbi:MAG: hypothetical protein ACRCWJ_17370 [Casimicrobium sp.]
MKRSYKLMNSVDRIRSSNGGGNRADLIAPETFQDLGNPAQLLAKATDAGSSSNNIEGKVPTSQQQIAYQPTYRVGEAADRAANSGGSGNSGGFSLESALATATDFAKQGAAIGALFGGAGAAIGGVVGAVVGFISSIC